MQPPDRPAYFDADRLVAEIFATHFEPPRPVSVSAFAAEHRWLYNEGGGYVGRWSNAEAPYLVEPMDALTDPDYLTVAVVKPGQCGGTTIAENWLLQSVANAPADLLWYMQTEPAVQNYVKTRINPMLDQHEPLRERLGTRPVDNSLGFKRFSGMSVQFLAAALNNLISKSAPRIVADEIDAWLPSMGNVKALLDVRRQTFGRESKLFALSHPDAAEGMSPRGWNRGIMAIYADSTRCTWWWPCPHCGAWSSPNPTARRVMTLGYPQDAPLDEIAEQARLECPVNGCLIEDHHRREMNLHGRWLGEGETIGDDGEVEGKRIRSHTAGYWIHGTMSPFILGGIGGLARDRVAAERDRENSGSDDTLRQVVVKRWGEPYAPRHAGGLVTAETLAERADPALRICQIPPGVRLIVAAVDVQANCFELLTRGYGEAGRSWVIDVRRIPAEPATSAQDWDDLFDLLITLEYPLADASGRVMRLRGAGFDSAGAPGVTQQAYAAWRRHRQHRRIRFLGQLSGRDVYAIMPMKGTGKPNAAPLQVVYPDSKRADRTARANGLVPIALFNANIAKDNLAGQLRVAEDAPFRVHLPAILTGNYPADPHSDAPPHRWLEQLLSETPQANGVWIKSTPGVRNEALDLMVMTDVLARLHGVGRITWDRPPPWARDWSDNPLVGAAAIQSPRARQTEQTVSLQPAAPTNPPQPYNAAAVRAARSRTYA